MIFKGCYLVLSV